MKKICMILLCISSTEFVSSLACFAYPNALMSNTGVDRSSWHFLEMCGGLKLGTPYRKSDGNVWLPIDCDLSGRKSISIPPVLGNSALTVRKVKIKFLKHQAISVSLVVGLPWRGSNNQCPDVKLGKLKAGDFNVFYDDHGGPMVPLGPIRVN